MALGALTSVAKTTRLVFAELFSFAGDASYPTGGTADFEGTVRALTKDQREVMAVLGQDCGQYRPVYDKANDKLKVIDDATGLEVANATDLSGVTFNVLVFAF